LAGEVPHPSILRPPGASVGGAVESGGRNPASGDRCGFQFNFLQNRRARQVKDSNFKGGRDARPLASPSRGNDARMKEKAR
jgi:hypothetical protein